MATMPFPQTLRLLTNLPNDRVDVYGCYDMPSTETIQCRTIGAFQRLPLLVSNWTIIFRTFHSPKSENRKELLSLDITLDPAMKFKGILVRIHPESSGFIYNELLKPEQTRAVLDISSRGSLKLILEMLFGIHRNLSPLLKTTIIIPNMDSGLKYNLKLIRPPAPLSFESFLMQSSYSTPEIKPVLNMEDAIITFHGNSTSRGLVFDLWADPDGPAFKIHLKINIIGSLAILVTKFRTLLVSVACAVFLLAIGELDWSLNDAGNLNVI